MAWPEEEIPELVEGETPTLLMAEFGNKAIDALRILGAISIEKGANDEVLYSDTGVTIKYGSGFDLEDFTGSVTIIQPESPLNPTFDLSKAWKMTFTKSRLTNIEVVDSGYELKEIVICEDGSPETYEFVIRSPE